MVRASFILAAAFACFALTASAQTSAPEKKAEPAKPKSKTDKAAEPKETAKPKIPLDNPKTPRGTIVVVVDELLKAMELFPKLVVMTPEEYQALQNQIKTLQRQSKAEKILLSFCKLQGKKEGNYLALRADFSFSTEQPNATVFLGLLGAHLMDEGELDGQIPMLDAPDDGFAVRVAKEGKHQLTLNLRVRIDVKRSTAGGTEQGVELGLPGAAVTLLHLELPANVKELRWNDTLEKTKTPGRWQIGLEKSKALSLSWKEPIATAGNAPLAKVEGQIHVRIDESHVNVQAELFLEDLRFQTKEWHLLLPPQAKMEVKPPAGLSYERIDPDGKNPYHTLRLQEATAERWQVSVLQRIPRPNPGVRLPIGPFLVMGAYQQQGTITVQMPTEASLGQRLVYYRQGNIYQLKNTETEATFQYVAPAMPEKIGKKPPPFKPPLELEWRYEKNQLETKVDHALKIRTVQHGWEIDATTRIQVDALFARINAVDLKLPRPRPRGLSLVGSAAPGNGFPAVLPWGILWTPAGLPWMESSAEETVVLDEQGNPLKLISQDALGKTRVVWERSPSKQVTLVLKNLIRIPPQTRRLHLELPRPLNTRDRGAKMSIQADDRIELLQGPPGAEEPVPDVHHFESSWDQAPVAVDLAWRPYQREIVAQAVVDIQLHEHTAQVTQALRFPLERGGLDGAEAKPSQVLLHASRAVNKVKVISGGEIISQNLPNRTLWLRPKAGAAEQIEVVLQYDVGLYANKEDAGWGLKVPFFWPAHVSRKEVKVRVWSPQGGMKFRLPEEILSRGAWKERSIEIVPGKNQFPALVLQGAGAQLPLTLMLETSTARALAAFLAERGLVQIIVKDDDSQHCRARFLIRKINAPYVDVELPLRVSLFRDRPAFFLGKYALTDWKTVDAAEKVVRLRLNPELVALPAVLEISYTLPADAVDSSRPWQTTLQTPRFDSEVVIEQLRWQLSLPAPLLAASLSNQVRVNAQWGWQGWLLTPKPAVTSAELENWLTTPALGGEPLATREAPSAPVTFAFSSARLQPYVIYHLERRWWLLSCSSLLLILILAVYLSPLPRALLWLLLLAGAVGILAVGMVWPALLPALLFGFEPGLLLLGLFVVSHWFWQERYRRQLVFLPAFARAKPSSTMVRSAGSAKKPREASTVDAPQPAEGGRPASASGT